MLSPTGSTQSPPSTTQWGSLPATPEHLRSSQVLLWGSLMTHSTLHRLSSPCAAIRRIDVTSWQRTSQHARTGFLAFSSCSRVGCHGEADAIYPILRSRYTGRTHATNARGSCPKQPRWPDGFGERDHLYVLIAVPNEHLRGESRHHLIGWRLPRSDIAAAIQTTRQRHKPDERHPDSEPTVQWTFVDDNRTAITTRRDVQRPVNWYANKRVELWGCGALGSWVAEHVVDRGCV